MANLKIADPEGDQSATLSQPRWIDLRQPVPPDVEMEMLENDLLTCRQKQAEWTLSDRRKALARLHPMLFGRIYFPDWMPKESPQFHWDISHAYMTFNRTIIAAPVSGAKTTIVTKICNLYSMFCEDWCWDQLIISTAAELVSIWIDDMARRCRASDELIEDYGEFWGQHWGSQELEFVLPDSQGKMHNGFIRALGRGGALRGRRPDRITLDDPEDEASVKSELQRKEYRQWLWGPLVNRLDAPHKKLTYIGTAFDPDALIVSLINSPPDGWQVRSYAMLNETTGESLWEEKFPSSFLQQRRKEIGEQAFQQEFQNNPVRNWNQLLFDPLKVTCSGTVYAIQQDDYVTLTVDPAFRRGGDAWALIVLAVDRLGQWHLKAAKKAQTGTEGWLECLRDTAKAFPVIHKAGIETGGGQASMEYTVQDYMRREGFNLNIEWLRHSRASGTKPSRIANLVNIINVGRLSLDPGMDHVLSAIRAYRANIENQEDNLLDCLTMQLEVQEARTPRERPEASPEELRHRRFLGLRKVLKQAREQRYSDTGRPRSYWDKYL